MVTLSSFTLISLLLPAIVFGNQGSPARFFLYTKSNAAVGQEQLIQANQKNISASKFMKNKPVKIISHGFGVNSKSGFAQSTKDAYLSLSEDRNIILVDWAGMRGGYSKAVKNIKTVGEHIAKLIKTLVTHKFSKYSHFHHIGHSLGAQIGAFISSHLPEGVKLKRATGLDPWVHQFPQKDNPNDRLDPTDAEFVDIITTFCHQGCNQTAPDLTGGTVDFFPNGGKHQPGCEDPKNPEPCSSHSRAHHYYAESITTKIGFEAYQCSSYTEFEKEGCRKEPVLMGAFVSTKARGMYYLDTNPTSPFAQGPKPVA